MAALRWGVIGLGYIAPRHLAAIRATGGRIVAACDIRDSVGVLDSYDLGCKFYMDEPAFWGACEGLDAVAVCTPNHLHANHAALALARVPTVILEKPAATDMGGLDAIAGAEHRHGSRCNVVLNLRHHPAVAAAREAYAGKRCTGELVYHTPRGDWYSKSWKADPKRSGGVALNIGVHLFDALCWMFGEPVVHTSRVFGQDVVGRVEFCEAFIKYELSTSPAHRPERALVLDGEPVDFTAGFGDLHTVVYSEALAGRGHGVDDCRAGLRLALGASRG